MIDYKMMDGKVRLIKYILYAGSGDKNHAFLACTEDERSLFLESYPDAKTEIVNHSGYDWLDGMTFTNDQVLSGEVERAAEMGEAAYMEYRIASDRDAQILDLDFRLSLLELGITEGGENV